MWLRHLSRIQIIHPWVLHVLGLRLLLSPCPLAARLAVAVHARRTVSPMHDVCAHNSWSDTVWNSRCTGGLLPVCKSASDHLDVCSQGPPGGGRGSKVGFPVWPKICVLSQRWRQG